MKKARMNISHSRFILFKLKIFGEIVTTFLKSSGYFTSGDKIAQMTITYIMLPVHYRSLTVP